MTGPTLLQLSEVTAAYGVSQALYGVDLQVAEGEVVALLGRNGMGKSTTVKTICRLLPVTGGHVSFAGRSLAGLPAYAVARLGIGLVPEGRRCFAKLSTYENLIAAAREGEWNYRRVCGLFPQLHQRRDQMAMTLSGGEQQMLAIARALMTNPRLLILDEATEGLAPVVRQEIWEAIRSLRERSLSILIVDKNLNELLPISDHCVILEKGASVWAGKPSQIDQGTLNRYLGL